MRASRSVVLTLLVLLAGVAAPAVLAAPAGASDANLRTLVHDQQKVMSALARRADAAGDRVGKRTTLATYRRRLGRYFASIERLTNQDRKLAVAYGARFAAETAETAQAEAGRVLMVQGLADEARADKVFMGRIHALRPRLRRVRTDAQYRRFVAAFVRAASISTYDRADERIKSARKQIRAAPTPVPAPAPAPEPTPSPSPTPSPIPGLPLKAPWARGV